jgi:hypothetical protein
MEGRGDDLITALVEFGSRLAELIGFRLGRSKREYSVFEGRVVTFVILTLVDRVIRIQRAGFSRDPGPLAASGFN